MLELKKSVSMPKFVPDYTATSLLDVDFKQLKKDGIRFVALDADSTLVNYRGTVIDAKTRRYVLEQKKHIENWCIASNRITNDLSPLAESIQVQIIPSSLIVRKPQKRYFRRIAEYFGAEDVSQIVMIGDKLIADVWGANRFGCTTVWVEHLGKDSLHDRAFRVRQWEHMMMRKYLS
jgi:HAD superfamily phosphatase (TIGR01668 family)